MVREEDIITRKRKVRSDKKRDIKPTISINLKDCIYRLSYVTNMPVKNIAATLCEKGLQSRLVIEYLSNYFRRNLRFANTIYYGDFARESLQSKYQHGKNERITIRFSQATYENIYNLSTALDVTPSKATALLLDSSIRNTNLLNAFVKTHLHEQLDNNRMKELKTILKYVNKNNPYNEQISWFALISLMYEEIKDSTGHIKDIVANWVEKYK